MTRTTRDRHLTPDEAARDRDVREKVEHDLPDLLAQAVSRRGRQLTLRDVHDDPRLLADFLQVPYEAGTVQRSYGGYRTYAEKVTADERVADAWRDYRRALRDDWLKRNRGQHWRNFIAECVRCGLGLKAAGALQDLTAAALAARPDLYRPPENNSEKSSTGP